METDSRIAVGIKLYIGQEISMGSNPNEFERYVTCSISGIDLGFDIDNVLECRYYDDMSGYIYFHFEEPVKRDVLEMFFEEEEIIDKLTNIINDEDGIKKQKTKQLKHSASG